MVFILGTPRVLTWRTVGWWHGWVAALIIAGIVVMLWWALTGIVGAVVYLATLAARLLVPEGKAGVRGHTESQNGNGEDGSKLHIERWCLIMVY